MFVSVDLPMPGEPPSSTSEPGTRPPPSTRSSSPMPVDIRSTGAAPTSLSLRGAPAGAPRRLREVGAAPVERMSTGIGELDRVLGGGLVPGSLVLLGGSPGIGKSTLTNMVLGHLQGAGRRTLYVSGEESAEQVRLRAERLAPGALSVPVLAETDLESILDTLATEAPQACVIDSVQT